MFFTLLKKENVPGTGKKLNNDNAIRVSRFLFKHEFERLHGPER